MAESAAQVHARVMAVADEHGRVPLPSVASWDDLLPPGPEDVWRADLASVARPLASHDGRAVPLDD